MYIYTCFVYMCMYANMYIYILHFKAFAYMYI